MAKLVYDAEGNYFDPDSPEGQALVAGGGAVEMVETIYLYTREFRVAVWAPVGVPKESVDFFVRDVAEHTPTRGITRISKAQGEARDGSVSINLAGRRRI